MAQPNPRYVFTPSWAVGSTDNTVRIALSAHNGTRLLVQDAEHPVLKVVKRKATLDEFCGDNWIDFRVASFVFDHVSQIQALKDCKQYFIRPSVMSAYLQKLMENGLENVIDDCHNIGELITCMVAIANKEGVGHLVLTVPDIIELEDPNSGTWFDEVRVGSMSLADKSGRAYAYMRCLTGLYTNPADLANILPVINQMPYSAQPIVGDIQNLPDLYKARMMGSVFIKLVPDVSLVRFVSPDDCMMEMYAAFNGDAFSRNFEINWASCYPVLAELGHANKEAKHPELRATPSDAANAVLAVARVRFTTHTTRTTDTIGAEFQ